MRSCGGVRGLNSIGAQDKLLLRSCFVEVWNTKVYSSEASF